MSKSSKPKKKQAASVNAEDNSIAIGKFGIGGDVSGDIHIGDTVIQPAPAPETHAALGSIPPASADTYVHRGNIEDDIRAALRKGGASAIVGLHAPGGTGKTELATRIAQEVKEGKFGFENVLWVDVNEKTAQEVLSEALRKCGVQLQINADETDKKAEWQYYLANHKLLVIFDDVRANAQHGLKELLPPAPCAALITSRIQQMAGVKEFALDHMEPEQARELFANSLGEEAVKAEEEMANKLAERCKYNPLALEIASRRIRQNLNFTNPIAKYAEKAEKRFEELKMHGDDRWNMTGVFDLSYNDLIETDQKYFRALSVFAPTGFSPNAAAHIWKMSEEDGAGDVLSRFINLSLVIPVKGDIERYRLHDLLDEYATLKLHEMGEEEKATSELAEWLINLFEEHYTDDFSNAPEVGLEFVNLAKTAEWAIANHKGDLLALLATKPRNWLYNYFRELNEWLNWLETSLKLGIDDKDKEGKQLKANVRKAIGDVQQFRKETDAAIESYNEALKLFRQVGDKLGEANVLSELAKLTLISGDLASAEKQTEEVAEVYLSINAIYSAGACYGNFSILLLNLGNKAKAKEYALKARQAFEKVGESTILKQVDQLIAACDE
jgi:tetratricopeptide (TPR) repeat protein